MSAAAIAAVADVLGRGPASAAELVQRLGLSQPTISRAIRALEGQRRVLRTGTRRGTRYLLRRAVAGPTSQWPIFRIAANGRAEACGTLYAIAPAGYYVNAGPARLRGLFGALPYYLQDAWPSGFLGRAIPRLHADLDLPARIADWTEAHFLPYLTQRATDSSGDLIVGEAALDRHLDGTGAPVSVHAGQRPVAYPRFANDALAGSPHGSSAHGEQPKFTLCVTDEDTSTPVLVKFSPLRSTPAGQRWADLLHAEHLAHRLLAGHGIDSCRSQLLEHEGRVFLECERFDRIGASGRRGTVSLHALDSARYGMLDNWTAGADRLEADGLLSKDAAARIRLLDAFGALIANTDRHFGNLSFFDDHDGPLTLAPVYDMLPMLFAPHDGQLVPRAFSPPPARAAWLGQWALARRLAESYWDGLARSADLGADFRELCAQCLAALRAAAR